VTQTYNTHNKTKQHPDRLQWVLIEVDVADAVVVVAVVIVAVAVALVVDVEVVSSILYDIPMAFTSLAARIISSGRLSSPWTDYIQ
jgi:hypothetical protein